MRKETNGVLRYIEKIDKCGCLNGNTSWHEFRANHDARKIPLGAEGQILVESLTIGLEMIQKLESIMPVKTCCALFVFVLLFACGDSESTVTEPDAGMNPSNDSTLNVGTERDGGEPSPAEDAAMPTADAAAQTDSTTDVDAMLPPATPIAFEQAASSLATAVCEFSARCDLLELLELVVNEPCDDFISAQFREGTVGAVQSGLDAGRIVYNAEAMGRCTTQLEVSDCGVDLTELFSVCDAAFEGQQSAGDACEHTTECQGNQACLIAGGCPGRCGPFPSVGESCTEEIGCDAEAVCFRGECARTLTRGASCNEGGIPCDDGLFCKVNPIFMTGACEPLNTTPVGLGATCDLNGGPYCDTGLACVAQPPAVVIPGLPAIPEFKCLAKVGEGEVCFAGAPDQCTNGFYCSGFNLDIEDLNNLDIEGTCLALPGEGEPCASSLVGDICNRGFVCNGSLCSTRQNNGGACTVDAECYGGSCYEGACAPVMPNACR